MCVSFTPPLAWTLSKTRWSSYLASHMTWNGTFGHAQSVCLYVSLSYGDALTDTSDALGNETTACGPGAKGTCMFVVVSEANT